MFVDQNERKQKYDRKDFVYVLYGRDVVYLGYPES